jgi:hypothetical protein
VRSAGLPWLREAYERQGSDGLFGSVPGDLQQTNSGKSSMKSAGLKALQAQTRRENEYATQHREI